MPMRMAIVGNITLDTIIWVDSLPEVDDSVLVRDSRLYYGGRGANIAIVARCLGLEVSLFSVVGEDFGTSGYQEYLTDRDIDIENTVVLTGEDCASFVLYIDSQGRSFSFFSLNAERHFKKILDFRHHLEEYDIIHLTKKDEDLDIDTLFGKTLGLEDKIVSVGIGEDIYRCSERFLLDTLSLSRYVFLNEKELEIYLGSLDVDDIAQILKNQDTRVTAIIVTRGARGSVIYTKEKMFRIPVVEPEYIATPLGAGDAYTGAFLYGISQRWDLQTCGRLAATLSSFVVEGQGAQTNIPDPTEVDNRFAKAFGYRLW